MELAFLCDTGVLPESGGVLDQDAKIFLTSRTLQGAYNLITKFRSLEGDAAIKGLSSRERLTLKQYKDMGINLSLSRQANG